MVGHSALLYMTTIDPPLTMSRPLSKYIEYRYIFLVPASIWEGSTLRVHTTDG